MFFHFAAFRLLAQAILNSRIHITLKPSCTRHRDYVIRHPVQMGIVFIRQALESDQGPDASRRIQTAIMQNRFPERRPETGTIVPVQRLKRSGCDAQIRCDIFPFAEKVIFQHHGFVQFRLDGISNIMLDLLESDNCHSVCNRANHHIGTILNAVAGVPFSAESIHDFFQYAPVFFALRIIRLTETH